MGRDQEARVCLNKLEEKKRNKPRVHFSEGLTLKNQGKYEEAILEFDKAIEMEEKSAHFHFYKGLALISLNKDQEAVHCFERTIEIWPKNPLYYCLRGRTLRSLNKQQDALTDFKKTQQIGKSGEKIFLVSISEVEHLTIVVNSILELQKDDEKAEKTQRQVDKDNLNIMKFVEDLKAFQVRKEKVITDLLTKIEEKYCGEVSPKDIHAVSQLRDDYQRLQKEIKEELSKEMDDFYKKFDVKVGDLDIGLDDQIRVKEYLKAFIETFSFAFEGSQAIENENYQLDIGCLFSTFASFAPFVRDTSGITSIGKFFSRKEIQRNAKKMLELFFDSSVYLNAMIGKTAEKIVLSQKKREHIVSITDKELDKISGNLLKKLSKFSKQMSRPMDINSYKELYNTPAARLGHMDANDLIQEYLKGEIGPERVQEEFVERTLKRQKGLNQVEAEEIKIKMKGKNEGGKEKCCNIF